MSDSGLMHYCLGIEVWQKEDNVILMQSKSARDLLYKFNMQDCKSLSTPMEANTKLSAFDEAKKVDAYLYRQLVGSLIYLTHTRPDIPYVVGMVSQFMQEPSQTHWKAAKRILRYVRGMLNFGLKYDQYEALMLVGYTNADWPGNIDDRRSTNAHTFSYGTAATSWSSKKQPTVALSSTEAEYCALSNATQEVIWLQRLLTDLGKSQVDATTVYCDNKSCIHLAKNPILHAQTKHIEIHHHSVREKIIDGTIDLVFCKYENQVIDIFTKSLGKCKFENFHSLLGIEECNFIIEGEC
ncbi:hypothetical protein O6H91_10G052900 [Diphasiastrum complanatum]|uniref:Uncharacterized protein n=1 Tax=Diphasiastrum complanatum TaxID=34168 RepID=A0ACC2CH87_DIPCM|nr:hypothetical protein O6H91_10G052900 [Diphasiastrum complanatum]